jgi:serine/threonine-protein kinase
LRETPANYDSPAFSPDGKRLALRINDGYKYDIWVYEWQRDTLMRLTFGDDRTNYLPVWTPDGQRITYASGDKSGFGAIDLYWKRADGTGEAQRLTETNDHMGSSGYGEIPRSWRPDGKVLAFDQSFDGGKTRNIATMTIDGNETIGWKPSEPQVFLKGPFTQGEAAFSPDGRWLAYQSEESGRSEVYVRPFSATGGKWQISTAGGAFPKWSRSGKELLYLALDQRIMVASYTASGDSFRSEKPRLWSSVQLDYLRGWSAFDVHPDGERLAVLIHPHASEEVPVNKVSFIFNFGEELLRKVSNLRTD